MLKAHKRVDESTEFLTSLDVNKDMVQTKIRKVGSVVLIKSSSACCDDIVVREEVGFVVRGVESHQVCTRDHQSEMRNPQCQ